MVMISRSAGLREASFHKRNFLCLLLSLSVQSRAFSISYPAPQTPQTPKAKPLNDTPHANGKKLTPQEAKIEAAKLALSSLKDVGSLFSSGNDDAMQPIDTSPVYENQYLFGTLNVIHQGQVVKELQDKYDKKWLKMNEKEKKLGYYIAYGNWGVRENFEKWDSLEAPWDLPFKIPSKIRKTNPRPLDKIKKSEPVVLAETDVRKQQFDTKKMDPVTKMFIYIALFVIMLALARDKKIGEKGKPVEYVTEDQYTKKKKEEQRTLELLEEAELTKARVRRWYYVWLK